MFRFSARSACLLPAISKNSPNNFRLAALEHFVHGQLFLADLLALCLPRTCSWQLRLRGLRFTASCSSYSFQPCKHALLLGEAGPQRPRSTTSALQLPVFQCSARSACLLPAISKNSPKFPESPNSKTCAWTAVSQKSASLPTSQFRPTRIWSWLLLLRPLAFRRAAELL